MKGTCKRCNRDVASVTSCVIQIVECDKQKHPPVLYGDEAEGWITAGRLPRPNCPICGVAIGKPHHKGCVEEKCPHCRHMAHNCGCSFKIIETKA